MKRTQQLSRHPRSNRTHSYQWWAKRWRNRGDRREAKRKVKSGKYDALSRIEHRDYWSYDD